MPGSRLLAEVPGAAHAPGSVGSGTVHDTAQRQYVVEHTHWEYLRGANQKLMKLEATFDTGKRTALYKGFTIWTGP